MFVLDNDKGGSAKKRLSMSPTTLVLSALTNGRHREETPAFPRATHAMHSISEENVWQLEELIAAVPAAKL